MSKLLTRILSAVIYGAIILGGILFSERILLLLIILLNFFCLNELFTILTKHSDAKFPKAFHLGWLTIVVVMFGVFWLTSIPVHYYWVFAIIPAIQFIPALIPSKQNLHGTVVVVSSLVLISLPLSLMLVLDTPHFIFDSSFLLAAVIFTWVNDSFAYFSGLLLGKHKLNPGISPNKTVEGFIGGFIFTALTGYLFSLFFPGIYFIHWLALALIGSLAATLGDLAESVFKRHYQLKDSGHIMPGHGGFLDRVDSILIVVPAFVVYLKIFALF